MERETLPAESPETTLDPATAETPWPHSFELLLRAHLPLLDPHDPIHADSRLDDLGLDSPNMIGLLVEMEDSFEFVFPDEFLTNELFETVGSFWAAVDRLR